MADAMIGSQSVRLVDAVYVFADIRGFTSWSLTHQLEVPAFVEPLYSLSVEAFGKMQDGSTFRRLVKFLGDGFFAVHEYSDRRDDFAQILRTMLRKIIKLTTSFAGFQQDCNLPDVGGLGIGFGVSFGKAHRYRITGYPTDYVGAKVNLSSRLCSIAERGEVVLDGALDDNLRNMRDRAWVMMSRHEQTDECLRGIGIQSVLRIQGLREPTKVEMDAGLVRFVQRLGGR